MSASRDVIERARAAGLSPAFAEAIERELMPRIDYVLVSVPELPPADDEEEALLSMLVEAYRPYLSLLLHSFDKLVDAATASLDDVFERMMELDPSKRRPLHHLEEAIASLVRVGTAIAASGAHRPDRAWRASPWSMAPKELPPELRPHLRGLLATLVALARIEGGVDQLVPWAWMARRETLKSEGLVMVSLRELGSSPPRPRRVPGAWKGRVHIADDFDAPLPEDVVGSFHGDADP